MRLLGRIAKANDKLHAFTEVYAKEAKAMADGADKARAGGFPLGPLHGLPHRLQGSAATSPAASAPAAPRCSRSASPPRPPTRSSGSTAAGMVPLGKLHMVEFAFGGWGTNPLMGAPWNPWDLQTHRAPAARRAAPASPSPRGSRRPASAATPAARCASPRRSTAWSA